MKDTTRKRKKAIRRIEAVHGRREIINRMYQVFTQGKLGFDAYMKEMGRIMAETIMYIEREELAGPDYRPFDSEIQKWASQGGSIYIGDQKIPTDHPRLRGPKGEIALRSYQRLKAPGGFSEELCQSFFSLIELEGDSVVNVILWQTQDREYLAEYLSMKYQLK